MQIENNAAPAVSDPIIMPTLHLQLTGYPVDAMISADYFEVDLFETPVSTITRIHEQGAIVLCYLNAGAWEDFRPDVEDFPVDVIGRKYDGWPGEKWLDIRNYPAFANIMLARMDLAVEKGCDGIDTDNVAGYQVETGFAITADDQINLQPMAKRAGARTWAADRAEK